MSHRGYCHARATEFVFCKTVSKNLEINWWKLICIKSDLWWTLWSWSCCWSCCYSSVWLLNHLHPSDLWTNRHIQFTRNNRVRFWWVGSGQDRRHKFGTIRGGSGWMDGSDGQLPLVPSEWKDVGVGKEGPVMSVAQSEQRKEVGEWGWEGQRTVWMNCKETVLNFGSFLTGSTPLNYCYYHYFCSLCYAHHCWAVAADAAATVGGWWRQEWADGGRQQTMHQRPVREKSTCSYISLFVSPLHFLFNLLLLLLILVLPWAVASVFSDEQTKPLESTATAATTASMLYNLEFPRIWKLIIKFWANRIRVPLELISNDFRQVFFISLGLPGALPPFLVSDPAVCMVFWQWEAKEKKCGG